MKIYQEMPIIPNNIVPIVGMVATICHLYDRYPAEVVRISKSGKTCWIRDMNYYIVSGSPREGTAIYSYSTDIGATYETRVNKTNKGWARQGGGLVWLNHQERYHEPMF